MSVLFSGSELSALVRAATILLSPLDYEDSQRWQRDACTAVQRLVDGDASSSAFPVGGQTVLGGEPRSAETLEKNKIKLQMILPAFVAGVKAYTSMMRREAMELATADAAPCGVALCDRNGVVLHLNAHLHRALSADREHETVRREISEAARAAITLAAKKPSIEATRRVASDVRTRSGRYTLSATLLENERLGGRVCAIVFVDAQTARTMDAKAIASRYGLTRRETEIALLLQRGHSSKEIAGAIGISVNTVRRHMERVMAKFNVHTRLGVAAKLIE